MGILVCGNTDFETLEDEEKIKLKERLGEDETGNDAYLRYVLSTLTNIEYLSLEGITNLKKIDFVKNMKNLVQLDIVDTGVEDLTILEDLTNSGNLLRFATLNISNNKVDLSKIQSTINNMYDRKGSYWNTKFGSERSHGLIIRGISLLNKLNQCDEIENLWLSDFSFIGDVSGSYDFSGMTSLKKISVLQLKVDR